MRRTREAFMDDVGYLADLKVTADVKQGQFSCLITQILLDIRDQNEEIKKLLEKLYTSR